MKIQLGNMKWIYEKQSIQPPELGFAGDVTSV
jgi:hypothetical protein